MRSKAMDVDVVVQLDADEFWPHSTFCAAIDAIKAGHERASIPHYIIWGNDRYQCTIQLDTTYLFLSHPRFLSVPRRYPQTFCLISHDGQLMGVEEKRLNLIVYGTMAGMDEIGSGGSSNFTKLKRGLEMPSIEEFDKWMASSKVYTVHIGTQYGQYSEVLRATSAGRTQRASTPVLIDRPTA